MKNKSYIICALAAASLLWVGCSREMDKSTPASYPTISEVFIDGFASDMGFEAWGKATNFDVDHETVYKGTTSMRIEVPNPTDPAGNWAGGKLYSTTGRDLSNYDALTFYAKSTVATTITVGFGEDGESKYKVTVSGLKLTSNWTKYYVPIPNAAKLTCEKGLFFYSAGAVDNSGYTLWFDNIRYEKLGTLAHPAIANMEMAGFPGTMTLSDLQESVSLPNGVSQSMTVSSSYFTLESSDPSVATVTDNSINVLGEGNAVISFKEAEGEIKLKAMGLAPAPTVPATDVMSLFSDTYMNTLTANWNPKWQYSTAEYEDINANGNHVARYSNLNFVGIVFNDQVNCTGMYYLHLDVMTTDAIDASSTLNIEVHNLAPGVAANTMTYVVNLAKFPEFKSSSWLSLDIPIYGLTPRANIGQLVLSSVNMPDVYLDNVFFHATKPNLPTSPQTAAPTPTVPSAQVISLFSDAYPAKPVSTWSADWDQADVADVSVQGNAMKSYSNMVYCGIEFPALDASSMTNFHMDVWTPDETASATFRVKLVDFGANGAYGGGDDVESELTFNASSSPALKTREWVSIDVPMSQFSGLVTKGHIMQMVLSGDLKNVFIDNLYFYSSTPIVLTKPVTAPAAPTYAAADVISLFSDTYTNRTVNTWSADWDNANVTDVNIAGTNMKQYDFYKDGCFAGIEFTSNMVDATNMGYFHVDAWAKSMDGQPKLLIIKLVDFGANGAYGGGDDVEGLVTLDASSSPAMNTDEWVSLDIPLSKFNLTTKAHLAQLLFVSANPRTMYYTNIYFHK